MPYLTDETLTQRTRIEGWEHVPNKPLIFFSGHVGNWELLPLISASQNRRMGIVYRKANNPHVDAMISGLRLPHADGLFAKGVRGAVQIVRAIKAGKSLAMLVDQKMNDGISVPFFGRDAMTAPAIAVLALKYDLPIIPARVIRTQGAHFKTIIYPPLRILKTGDHAADVKKIMSEINLILEFWVRDIPDQWFWVHKRWPN
jgi:KDO2-lipid IV(A) lauroyltransferase